MSHHLDRDEFDEITREEDWDRLWSAYQYARDGDEQSVVSRLRERNAELEGKVRRLQNTVDVLLSQ
jgi:hypothetical protein